MALSVSLHSSRPEEAGAEVPLLPLDALHALAEQLDQDNLEQALLLLKLFIILCRWFLPGILQGWAEARMYWPRGEGD